MDRPEVGSVAEVLNQELAPLLGEDEANGWAGLAFLGAAGSMVQGMEDLIRDSDEGVGWSGVFDVENVDVEALPYIAQFLGSRTRPGLADAAQRARIVSTDGILRGGLAAFTAAAKQYLTGTKTVYLYERQGSSAWQISVATLASETPDTAAVLDALLEQKPAGITLTYAAIVGGDYATLQATHTDYADVLASFTDYADVLSDPSQ